MKKRLSALCLASLLSTTALANTDQTLSEDKHWQVGIGSYALTIEVDDSYNDSEDDFVGGNFSVAYAFTDSFSVRGQFYALEHDDFSEIEVSGAEFNAYYGTGMLNEGFKAFIGGGFYTETLEFESVDEDFSGVQLSGGVGYNWEHVSLDFALSLRSVGDYADFADVDDDDTTAAAGSLNLSYRF